MPRKVIICFVNGSKEMDLSNNRRNRNMKETTLNGNALSPKKIIAIVLVLVSLACLFSPCVVVHVKVSGSSFTMKDIYRYAGTSEKEIETELRDQISDINDEFSDYGIRFKTNKFVNLICNLLDGKITLLDMAKSCSLVKKTVGEILKVPEIKDELEITPYVSAKQINSGLATATAVMWVFIAAAVASALYAVYAILTDKKRACLVYTIIVALLVIVIVLLVKGINAAMISAGIGFTDLLEDIDMIDQASVWNLRVVKVGNGVFLSLLLVVVAGILAAGGSKPATESVPAIATEPVVAPRPVANKTCSNCGATVQADHIFCAACGTDLRKKPEPPKCPACGTVVDPNAAFCGYCGNAMRR